MILVNCVRTMANWQQHQQQQQQYFQQQYNHYQQPNQHYGGYGQYFQNNVFQLQAWQAYGFTQKDELWSIFEKEMHTNPENMRRQAIQTENLLRLMNESPSIRNYYGINWSRELCAIMLAMLDRSRDGFMQWNEFQELQQCLVEWHRLFGMYDFNHDRKADARELLNVIVHTFRYNISPKVLETLLKRYAYIMPGGNCVVAFDDFVTLSVRLRALTDAFRGRDQLQHHQETGQAQFDYDDFLRCVLCL